MKKAIFYIGIILLGAIIIFHVIIFQKPEHIPTLTETIFSNEHIKSIEIFNSKGYYSLYINKDSLGFYSSIDSLKMVILNYK